MNHHPGPDIAIFIPSNLDGGSEKLAVFIGEALQQAGLRVDLIYACERSQRQALDAKGLNSVCLGAVTEILALPQYLKYLKNRKPRCVLAMVHTAKMTAGLGKLFAKHVPVILGVQTTLLCERKYRFWFRKFFGFGIERFLYQRCEHMIGVSDALAKEVETVFAQGKVPVTAINNPLFEKPPLMEDIAPDHEHYFDKPVVLGIGRLIQQKNFELLIDAFRLVRDKIDARLMILGEGPDRQSLEDRIAGHGLDGDVIMPGWVTDTRPYLRRASLFVLSSRFEGFGLVCVEALAERTRSIFLDTPHGPRDISGNGKFARLIAMGPDNKTELAEAIVDELQNPPPENGTLEQEWRSWLQRYMPETIGPLYVKLVRQVLQEAAQ